MIWLCFRSLAALNLNRKQTHAWRLTARVAGRASAVEQLVGPYAMLLSRCTQSAARS